METSHNLAFFENGNAFSCITVVAPYGGVSKKKKLS